MPAIVGLVGRSGLVQPRRQQRAQAVEVRLESWWRCGVVADRTEVRVEVRFIRAPEKIDLANGVGFQGNEDAGLMIEKVTLRFVQSPVQGPLVCMLRVRAGQCQAQRLE
ncbi:hypothetical protein D3C76_1017410 [compost metagenome]